MLPRLPFLLAVAAWAWSCSASPQIEISVEPNPIVADAGEASIQVKVSEGAERVRVFASRGQITDVSVGPGGTVQARLIGVDDVGEGFVGVQASVDGFSKGLLVAVAPGAAASIAMQPRSAFVDADVGKIELDVAVVDAKGNPIVVDDLKLTPAIGQLESLVQQPGGTYLAAIAGLHDRDASPVVISANGGGVSSATSVTILAGAAGQFEIELPDADIEAGSPFQLTLRSLDRWGNYRNVFGEIAYLSAYRLSDPLTVLPVSPQATNLFENGAVTMDVTLHGWGPDIVLRVGSSPTTAAVVSETPAFVVPEPEIGCVRIEPTGLDSRVQPAQSLGRLGGFPLRVLVSSQTCQSIVSEGERFSGRLAGFTPKVYATLNGGQAWGNSVQSESGGEKVGAVGFNAQDVTYPLKVSGLTRTAWTPVLVTAEVNGKVGAVELEITPGDWRAITFTTVPDQFVGTQLSLDAFGIPLTFNTGFGVGIFATDLYGNVVITATGNVNCQLVAAESDTLVGSVLPVETFSILLGQLNQYLGIQLSSSTPPQTGTDARLKCSVADVGAVGYSNTFKVFPQPNLLTQGQATDFLVKLPGQSYPVNFPDDVTGSFTGTPTPQIAGQPFQIEIVARSAADLLSTGTLPGLIELPTFAGRAEIDALLGVAETLVGNVATARADSPLTPSFTCNGNADAFVTNEPLAAGTLVCDTNSLPFVLTRGMSIVKPWVRVFSASNNQILTVNPAIPSIPLPSFKSNMSLISGFSSAFVVQPAALAGLSLAVDVTESVGVGDNFNVEVRSIDAYGNAVTGINAPLQIEDLSGTVWPKSANLSNGVAALSLQIFQTWSNNMLTVRAESLGLSAQSQVFDVAP